MSKPGDSLRNQGPPKSQAVADALDALGVSSTAAIAAAGLLIRDRASFRQAVDSIFTTSLPYYTSDCFNTLTTVTPSQNVIRAIPFIAPRRGGTLDRIGIYCTVLGAASHARVGIYTCASDANFYPTSLVASSDGGALDTSGTGLKTNTISIALTGGQLYWLAHLCDTGGATIRGVSGSVGSPIVGVDPSAGTAYNAIFVAQSYGALPSTFPASASMAGSDTAAVFVRFSA